MAASTHCPLPPPRISAASSVPAAEGLTQVWVSVLWAAHAGLLPRFCLPVHTGAPACFQPGSRLLLLLTVHLSPPAPNPLACPNGFCEDQRLARLHASLAQDAIPWGAAVDRKACNR